MHRLMTSLRQIDNCQPSMPEREACIFINPYTTIIGATVHEGIVHPGNDRCQITITGLENSAETTHQ
jgi:hypothetical protein